MAAAVGAATYDQDINDLLTRAAEAVAAARQAGDAWCLAYALWPYSAAVLVFEQDVAGSLALADEGIAAARLAGDPVLEAMHLRSGLV
jgi:hypothetical protein